MRKIIANLFITLDGVVDAPSDWHFPYFNDEMARDVDTAMSAADTMLLGRVTYEAFVASWPDREDDGAEFMNKVAKVVVSTTLEKADWNNSTIISDNVADEITALKQRSGGTIFISGSVTLVRWLLGEGLLDELHLLVHPIVLGKGARLFDNLNAQVPLHLIGSSIFSTGVVSLTYAPVRG